MYRKLPNEGDYRKFYFQDSFYAQCVDVNPLTMDQFERSVETVKKIIDQPIFKTAKHIISSGCGDSNLVGFAAKEAFAHYLPDVDYEAVESIELGRHYDYPEDGSDTLAFFVSVSGTIFRTVEAIQQCKAHGITTVGVTDNPKSVIAGESDILCHTNSPKGDNNAGLRTIYCNLITLIILAAAMAEKRTGKPCIEELRQQVQAYHDLYFSHFDQIDEASFRAAVHWMNLDASMIEICADGPMYWMGRLVHAKIVELSGDPCTTVTSEEFCRVNRYMHFPGPIAQIVLLNGNDSNRDLMISALKTMAEEGRKVALFSDLSPEELGVEGDIKHIYVPMPPKEWNFLASIYGFLAPSILAGFRHTTIGEPMFRGGLVQSVFVPSYFAEIDLVDINREK